MHGFGTMGIGSDGRAGTQTADGAAMARWVPKFVRTPQRNRISKSATLDCKPSRDRHASAIVRSLYPNLARLSILAGH